MSTKALKWLFKMEKEREDRSGLYGFTQRSMAYNSNRIEGSTLTEEQTAALFEEGFLPASEEMYISKDIEEMNGHFLMFNKMLSVLGNPLSEDIIKSFHYELKAGVFEDRANGYAIGEYKKFRNTVGGLSLSEPELVNDKMKELLSWYHNQNSVTIETLAEFHAKYELIHPFQDGNGRTGRMILFKECLDKDIIPFIIRNENRQRYISTLHEAQTVEDYYELTAYLKTEQLQYNDICISFDVFNRFKEHERVSGILNNKNLQNEPKNTRDYGIDL